MHFNQLAPVRIHPVEYQILACHHIHRQTNIMTEHHRADKITIPW